MTNRYNTPNPQYFIDPVTGAPLAGGFLYFYASGTNTPLNTYSDQGLTVPNTNPVVLDSNGYAGTIFLQNLAYKVVLTDSTTAQQWTEDPVSTSDYTTFAQVKPYNGNPNGKVAGTASTVGSLPGSSMIWDYVNNILYVATVTGNASTTVWTAVNPANAAAVTPQPTGRLTLTSGTPVLSTDVVGSTIVVYTSYVGNTVPIYNGATMTNQVFTELTLTLTASQAANTIYDVFVFNNSGVLTLVTGPAWTNSAAGAGARGTGASTTQLSRISGIWTNTVQIAGKNSSTTYTIAAGLATYLGSVYVDATAGQVSCYTSWGNTTINAWSGGNVGRKWGVWNAYNRVPVYLKAGDATASWTYATNTARASNGVSNNSLAIFSGLPEDVYDLNFMQRTANTAATNNSEIVLGLSINSLTVVSGTTADWIMNWNNTANVGLTTNQLARYLFPPALGLNVVNSIEKSVTGTNTYYGTESSMLISARWVA